MTSDAEVGDPLLRAIAELRIDLKILIDEQVALVKERVEEPSAPRGLRVAPAQPLPAAEARDEAAEAAAKARSLDPRQRLDALAKHLDHRLRQANSPMPERAE